MFGLPNEIESKIFMFDPTKKELFDKTVHQLNMIPVLSQLELRASVFSSWWGDEWMYFYFSQVSIGRSTNFSEPVEIIRDQAWNRFLKRKLRLIQ